MLEGEVVYRHADRCSPMQPGDSLFFDADAPHGPEELVNLPAAISPSSPIHSTAETVSWRRILP